MLTPDLTFEQIQAAWLTQFPSTSPLISILRTALIFADWHCRQIQSHFYQLHRDLIATGLPMHHWDPLTLDTFTRLQRLNSKAQRDFHHALRILQASYQPPPPQPKPPAPPPEPEPPSKTTIFQTVYLSYEDGKLVTRAEPDAAFFVRLNDWDRFSHFTRQFHFKDAHVPEPYLSLLTDEGITYEPQRFLQIGYWPDVFAELCQRELQTNSEHLLDSEERSLYKWRK